MLDIFWLLLDIFRLLLNIFRQLYDIFLKEVEGDRFLIIGIGELEAKRIIALMDDIVMPRPLTHDLVYNVLTDFGIGIDCI